MHPVHVSLLSVVLSLLTICISLLSRKLVGQLRSSLGEGHYIYYVRGFFNCNCCVRVCLVQIRKPQIAYDSHRKEEEFRMEGWGGDANILHNDIRSHKQLTKDAIYVNCKYTFHTLKSKVF